MTSILDKPIPKPDPNTVFPLAVIISNEPGATYYIFPRHHFLEPDLIKNIYNFRIFLLEHLHRDLTDSEKYEVNGLKHGVSIDPRLPEVCYGLEIDAVYAIEAATYLEADDPASYLINGNYLCDWYKCYPFESTAVMNTPEVVSLFKKISSRKRKPIRIPHYSDYHFHPGYKVEILPGDHIAEDSNILTTGDRLIVVTRAVENPTFAKWTIRDLIGMFRFPSNDTVENRLKETISEQNRSLCVYMGYDNPPQSGCMLTAIYLTPDSMTFAQVGTITIKKRIEKHYETITENHTFDNPEERYRTKISNITRIVAQLAKKIGIKTKQFIRQDELDYLLVPTVPSRFIGHPYFNTVEEYLEGNELISAKPFIKTISLGEK